MTRHDTDFHKAGTQPVVFVRAGEVFATSRDVADFFEKEHRNVLRDIAALIAQAPELAPDPSSDLRKGVTPAQFRAGVYTLPETGSQVHRMFEMNRDAFTLLAMGFTDAKALTWKLRYIEAFNQMEAALRAPKPAVEEPAAAPLDELPPESWETWLGVVRETRRAFGRKAAQKVWHNSPLPKVEPQEAFQRTEEETLIIGFIEENCTITGMSSDFLRSRTLINALQSYAQEMDVPWPGDRRMSIMLKRLSETYRDPDTGQRMWAAKRSDTGYCGVRID